MAFRSKKCRRNPCGHFLILLCISLMPTFAVARADCGQAEITVLSDVARTILGWNQSLSSGPTRIAGLHPLSIKHDAGLLQSRAQLLRELMATHPEEVRAVLLPAAVASKLLAADPANAPFIEHDAALAGDLAAVQMDDFNHGVASRVYVLHDPVTGSQIAVHPGTDGGLQSMLHRTVSVRGVQVGADVLAEAITPTNLGVNASPSLALQAAAVPATNTTLTCTTTGQQRTAVLMLQFPNNSPAFPGDYGTTAFWQQAISGTEKSVNSLWAEMSSSIYATVDVYGPLTLPRSYGCADYLAMRSAALTLASSTIDLSRYTRIVLAFPESTCSYGGLADIGCNSADTLVPHPYSVVWMPIVTSYTASTGVWGSLAHELGHNLGLNHANTLDFGTASLGPIDFQATNPGTVGGTGATTAAGVVTAIDTEYGDVFSVMGNPWSAGPGPYSAEHRARLLDWIPASGTSNGLGTITASGSYTLQPASTGSGLRSLRVLRDAASASWIWLEYRNGGTTLDAANLAAIRGQNAAQGAVVHYENGYGDHGKTYQLDMSPTGKGNRFADGALLPGTTWSDPYSPLSLTVNSVTSAGLSVSVNYDSTCATFSTGSSPIDAAGANGTVAVTASATCTWKASSNGPWITLSGTVSGTGSGSFTWTASANSGVGQRVTYLTVGRVSQRLLQLGSGANVLALSPANATVDPGSSNVFSLNLRDTGGIADLQTVELDALAAGAQPCVVVASFTAGVPTFFLLNETSSEFTGGLAAGAAGQVSTDGCTLSGKGSGASVSGSTLTLALNLAFSTTAPGVRALYATANSGTELPVGILNVGTVTAPQSNPTTNPPNATLKATTTTLTGTPSAALYSTSVTLSALVSAGSGTSAPTGKVTWIDGTVSLGTATLDSNGRASLTTTTLSNGTHTLTALYSGDSTFAASTSAAVSLTVAQATSSATLTSSVSTVTVGGSATLAVSIGHAGGTNTPSGTVTLRDGSAVLSTATLREASATFPLSGLSQGTHTLTAAYSGDAIYLPTTSNVLTITVNKPAAVLTIAMPPMALAGSVPPVRVTVAPALPGTAATPTGTVLLQDGARTLGTVALVNGTGTLAVSDLATGAHTIAASYSGDSTFDAAGTGPTTVSVLDFSIAGPGTQADITVSAGAATGNSATLMLTPGTGGFPLNVAFVCNGAPSGATCTVTPGAVTPGNAAVPVTITVLTTAPASSRSVQAAAAWFGLPLFGLLMRRRTRRSVPVLLVIVALPLLFLTGITGCGTGVSGSAASSTTTTTSIGTVGTPAGRSTLTVQAVATSNGAMLTHTATVTLRVN